MVITKENTLSELVKDNYKFAQVFERYGLDFCCGGNKSLFEACEKKGLNAENVIKELTDINGLDSNVNRYNDWSLNFLADYVVNNHHLYARRMISTMLIHGEKAMNSHGKNNPELIEIFELLYDICDELSIHMEEEEKILFPYIKYLVDVKTNGKTFHVPAFESIKNVIIIMEKDHKDVGNKMSKIRELSNNYNAPGNACNTYKVYFNELKEFEIDLHKHVHLENNILFPKAFELESEIQNELSLTRSIY